MMNLKKTAEEINRLRKLVANQKDTIEKAMKVIEQLADDCCKLQAENEKLKTVKHKLEEGDIDECRNIISHWQTHAAPVNTSDIIFPNTDERGLGDGDTPTDLSPLDL